MTTCKLEFLPSALKEWQKFGATVHEQLKKKIAERLIDPAIPSSRLRGAPDLYKIKLRTSGYRLVYRIEQDRLVVVVVAVGKRDKSGVYRTASARR